MLRLLLVLAFARTILICAGLGAILTAFDRWTTSCPNCGELQMRQVNAIGETYPTGRGTGRFSQCGACGRRSF